FTTLAGGSGGASLVLPASSAVTIASVSTATVTVGTPNYTFSGFNGTTTGDVQSTGTGSISDAVSGANVSLTSASSTLGPSVAGMQFDKSFTSLTGGAGVTLTLPASQSVTIASASTATDSISSVTYTF